MKYSEKFPFIYPARMLGAERHWRNRTMHQRMLIASRETASANRPSRYHVFVEDAPRFRLTTFDRLR